MTATAFQDPIASMVTMPLRAFAPPVLAPVTYIRTPVASAHPAPPLHLATQRPHGIVMPVAVVAADRQLQRFALGLLLTVLLLGIPLATYLASMT